MLKVQLDMACAAPGWRIKSGARMMGALRVAHVLDKDGLASWKRFCVAAGVMKHLDFGEVDALARKITECLPLIGSRLNE